MVVLYTTGCVKCKSLKARLDAKEIKYDIVDDLNVMESKGFMSVPVLEVDGKTMRYEEAMNWINKYKGEN